MTAFHFKQKLPHLKGYMQPYRFGNSFLGLVAVHVQLVTYSTGDWSSVEDFISR